MPEVSYSRFSGLSLYYIDRLLRLSAEYYRLASRIRRAKRITSVVYDSFLKELGRLDEQRSHIYTVLKTTWWVRPWDKKAVYLFDELKEYVDDVEKERNMVIELLKSVAPKALWQPFICVYTWIATREQKTRFGMVERIIEVHFESEYRPDLIDKESLKEKVHEIIYSYCKRANYDFIFSIPNVLEGEAEFTEIPKDFHERMAFSWQFLEPREKKESWVESRIEIYDHTYDRLVASGKALFNLRWWTASTRDLVNALIHGSTIHLRQRGRKSRQMRLGERE